MIEYYLKFAFIGLCFLIALGSYRFCINKKDWAFLAVAMGFTLLADFFLVLVHNYVIGVFVFCFVHIAYIFRVSNNRKHNLFHICATVVAGVVLYAVFLFVPILPPPDVLIILAMVYATLFSQNLVAHIKYSPAFAATGGTDFELFHFNRKIMLVGLILFAFCDIHVLMLNLPNYLPVPQEIASWGQTMLWVFYLPSQLLLSLSAVRWKL